jgi:4-amino-4-deoxy-L-arabinose transferase-like glycosyltransferase
MHDEPRHATGSDGSRRALAYLALLGLVSFFPWLGARDLWNPDEPRYAEVAREMGVDGRFLVPHLNGEIYTQKPPLFFWAINAAALVSGGLDERAARLPSALAALGTTLLVFAIGRRLFDPPVAWMAALVYATSFKVLWQARVAQIDMLLTFLVTLSAWCWLRGYQESSVRDYRLFFLVAGLATLTKGPVGLLPFMLTALVFLWASDRKEEIRAMQIGRGLLIWAGVVAAWLLAATLQAGTGYLRELVLTQNLTRYFDPGSTPVMSGHLKPWYHYLTTLPLDFLPWSVLLPAAFWVPWREGAWRREPGYRLAVCWTVVPLLFFSLSPAKRSVYLLPLFPAAALLVAFLLDAVARTGRRHRLSAIVPFSLVGGVFLLVAALLPVAAAERPELLALGGSVPVLLTMLLGLIGGAALAGAWAASRGRTALAATLLAAAMAPVGPLALGRLLARADPLKSVRPVTDELLERLGPEEEYGVFPKIDGRALFYTRRLARELPDGEALRCFAAEGGRWVVARRDALARVEEPPSFEVVAGDGRDDEGVALLRLLPAEPRR